jgi:hypothetical protein
MTISESRDRRPEQQTLFVWRLSPARAALKIDFDCPLAKADIAASNEPSTKSALLQYSPPADSAFAPAAQTAEWC